MATGTGGGRRFPAIVRAGDLVGHALSGRGSPCMGRNGGRLTDLVCGLIAGAVAGLAGKRHPRLCAGGGRRAAAVAAARGAGRSGDGSSAGDAVVDTHFAGVLASRGGGAGVRAGAVGPGGSGGAGGWRVYAAGVACWRACAGWGMRRSFLRCGGNEEGDLLHNSSALPRSPLSQRIRAYLPCSSSNRTRSPSPAASAERNISRCPRNCSSASSSAGRLLRKIACHSSGLPAARRVVSRKPLPVSRRHSSGRTLARTEETRCGRWLRA